MTSHTELFKMFQSMTGTKMHRIPNTEPATSTWQPSRVREFVFLPTWGDE